MLVLCKMEMLMLVVLLASASAASIDYHDTLDDNFDFTVVSLEDFRKMVRCLTYDGPCDNLHEIVSYRQHYPAAVEEACGRCNVDQKHTARVFFDRLEKELPEEFQRFLDKYDPQRKYYKNFYNNLKDF